MNAIIFDLDDTLIASAPLWKSAESSFLDLHGHTWSPELAAQYKGMNGPDVARFLHQTLNLKGTLEANQREFGLCLASSFAEGPIDPMPGALDLIDHLNSNGHTMAVASGSPLQLIELALWRLGRLDRFATILSSESVARGKPFPDVFLKVAELLEKRPGDCLVIEDSLIGVQAAKAAGMAVLAIPSRNDPAFQHQANECLPSLTDWQSSHLLARIDHSGVPQIV